MRINQNIAAMNAYRNLSVTNEQMGKSLEKLSSGFRINRAADDAAGLSISEGLRSQVGGLKAAVRNAQDGISVVQTAEGALTEVHAILQRVRDLTIQSKNTGSVGTNAQNAINVEIGELGKALTDIASQTNFNGKVLLSGAGNALTFQTGAEQGEQLTVSGPNLATLGASISALTLVAPGAGQHTGASQTNITTSIDNQIDSVSTFRATLGASQNRLDSTINSLNVAVENLSASESRIRDTDMAQEMVRFTRNQILSQAGTAMLSQANQAPQSVLSLLR